MIGAKKYSFKEDKTERQVEGMQLFYLDEPELTENVRGCLPLKSSVMDLKLWPDIKEVPGIYDLDFKLKPDSKGKPSLALVGIQYKGKVNLPFNQ